MNLGSPKSIPTTQDQATVGDLRVAQQSLESVGSLGNFPKILLYSVVPNAVCPCVVVIGS